MDKFINTTSDSDAMTFNAYPVKLWDSSVDLWDQNIADQYIIAYEINSGLAPKIQNMLPKVSFGNIAC